MIRSATVLVFVVGVGLAAGVFTVMRNVGPAPADTTHVDPVPAAPPEPTAPPAPTAGERHRFLSDIDLNAGQITVLVHPSGPDAPALIIRDMNAFLTAQSDAYVAAQHGATQLRHQPGTTAPAFPVVQIFRDDMRIGSIDCPDNNCGTLFVELAGLDAQAMPHEKRLDRFDDHALYLETITAIATSPDFMLLDQRPAQGFPAERQIPTVTVTLPTLEHGADDAPDPAAHGNALRRAITPLLPDGASISRLSINPQPPAIVIDRDNGRPITAGGVPIPFTGTGFATREMVLSGVSDVSLDRLSRITEATRSDFDRSAIFADFVAGRLQSTCSSCYAVQIQGGIATAASITDWQPESYTLSYYDLRDTP